jgi:hypothetical protein
MTRSDRVATLEEAKAQFQKSWDAWKAWARMEEQPGASVTRTSREAAVIDDNPEPLPEDVPQLTHLSPKAVELFQRALEIEAAGAAGKWEPEGRRLEYIDIDIALMRELGQGFWGVSVLDVHENAEGPPEWERNSRNIESWHEAIRLRRALEDALRDVPEVQSSANVQNDL